MNARTPQDMMAGLMRLPFPAEQEAAADRLIKAGWTESYRDHNTIYLRKCYGSSRIVHCRQVDPDGSVQ